MNPDIVIIREDCGYRLLHGHLRLSNALSSTSEVVVDVVGGGAVKVMKSRQGYIVGMAGKCLPLL